jgi:membrane protease YdiL (CAAX protease family)
VLPALTGSLYATAIHGWRGIIVHAHLPLTALMGGVLYVVTTPLVEEFYFRHVLHLEILQLFRHPFTVAAVNSVWFAAIHVPYNMPLALITGLCCTALRMRTRGLGWPIVAHALTNLVLEILQQ